MTGRWVDHFAVGIHSARPSASAVPKGAFYSCTTHGLIYQSDGSSTWATWATLGSTGGGLTAVTEVTTPSTPGAGTQTLFLDSSDHHLKRVNSSGTVTDLEGGGGGAGGADQVDWHYEPYHQRLAWQAREVRTGTYAYSPSSMIGDGFLYNSSAAINDTLDFYVWLAAGTYDLYVVGSTDNNRGIQTWQVDDGAGTFSTLGTLDWYTSFNALDTLKTLTSLTVTGSSARRKLRSKIAAKNASSSGYFTAIQTLDLVRTA